MPGKLPVFAFRLKDETALLLKAMKECRPRQYLTYEELIADCVRCKLTRDRTLNAEVTRWIAANSRGQGSPPAQESQ